MARSVRLTSRLAVAVAFSSACWASTTWLGSPDSGALAAASIASA